MIEVFMQSEDRQKQVDPTLSFHLMKFAVQDFQKNTWQLTREEYNQAWNLANEEMLLHRVILNSEEACCVVIPEENIRQSLRKVIADYQGKASFHANLRENNLQLTQYVEALHNDLRVETVLAKVAATIQSVAPREIGHYYRKHKADFVHPEQRIAAHIQISSHPSLPPGTDPGLLKITEIYHRISLAPHTFGKEARLHSQCSSKEEGGNLGILVAGDLCDELDKALFSLEGGAISPIIESGNGYHILQCKKILPGKKMRFSEALPAISARLLKRKQLQACRSWLVKIMNSGDH